MSPYHFCRQFKKSTGQSPYQYVIERRVEKGKRLLEETDQLVVQVAFAVGYENQSRFTHQFKKRVGTTPGPTAGSGHDGRRIKTGARRPRLWLQRKNVAIDHQKVKP